MSNSALQKNLERLIKEKDYQIAGLERRAGLRKNNIYNILKGLSKKPSAEILQSIADTLGVSVKDLYSSSTSSRKFLNKDDYSLIEKVIKKTTETTQNLNIEMTLVDFINVTKEIFEYSAISETNEPDDRFIRWTLQQKFKSKN